MQFEESVSNYTTLNLFHDINSLVVLNFRHFTTKLPISVQRRTEYTDKRPHDNERCLMLKYNVIMNTFTLLYVASFLVFFPQGFQHAKGFRMNKQPKASN